MRLVRAVMLFGVIFLAGTSAIAQTQQQVIRDLMAWVKADGQDGVLEGRLAKALGLENGEDVAVRERTLRIGSADSSRFEIPLGKDFIVLRKKSGAGEMLWRASLDPTKEAAVLEAAVYVDRTGKIRVDRVSRTRGDDGFNVLVKTWLQEWQKYKPGGR